MRGIIALFIWLGIPLILIRLMDLKGEIWLFLLCGVFGIAALWYYALSSKT